MPHKTSLILHPDADVQHLNANPRPASARGTGTQAADTFPKALDTDDVAILLVPRKLFHPERILILKILERHGAVDFRDLKEALHVAEGNLASHLRTLEGDGYIEIHKTFEGRRPRTSCELTPMGRRVFSEFLQRMSSIVR
jgi:DNA-binding MarR family transcriptional regulator